MAVKRITTEDGSDSLYVPELDETYHSIHGAIQESEHVFIKNGLQFVLERDSPEQLDILEFGFGTGLNVLLTWLAQRDTAISITSLEKYPVEAETAAKLNYGLQVGQQDFYQQLVDCPWEKWHDLSEQFKLLKLEIDFADFVPKASYDLIYFDAFSPGKQPELWSYEMMQKCWSALKKGGVFVTYSAKGQLRRDLQHLGFIVERLPGPPGKFEMLRAVKY